MRYLTSKEKECLEQRYLAIAEAIPHLETAGSLLRLPLDSDPVTILDDLITDLQSEQTYLALILLEI